MLNWQKRRSAPPGLDTPRVFRVAPQSPAAPTYLVPKAVPAPCAGSLDPRGAFVVHLADAVFVWRVRLAHLVTRLPRCSAPPPA